MTDAKLIDGKHIAAQLVDQIAAATKTLQQQQQVTPGLAVILVGENPASQVYVRNKGRMAEKCGFHSVQYNLPETSRMDELVTLIKNLNEDKDVHGILVQLPLPSHMDESEILKLISPAKDVDGFHPLNIGLLYAGQTDEALIPCTPAGSVLLAKSTLPQGLSGLNAVIIGRSNIVGKPVAQLLLQENCTITIAHSRTRNLPELVKMADIVIAAVGRPEMIQGEWIKKGAVIIDVGINRVPAPEKGEGKTKLVGDVDFNTAKKVAAAITPVPGGVGPMTIAMLMANTYTAATRITDNPDYQITLSV
ncbi:MAG: bifunctional methylenetetrahydrofolate dehydrogenase/methenyltetrahydrofolate cyclohydrolase FolD [bacterium]